MKKVIVLLVALIGINTSHSQVQSDCTVPPELITYYERDIKHLAVCRMFQLHSPDTAMVTIPQEYIDTIAKGMAGIINAMSVIPESDSVFNLYCVHNIKGCIGEYDGFLVKVDTSYSWTDAWQNMQTMTGDPLMDTIIVRYSLYIQQFYFFSSGCVAKINSSSTWNLNALCDTLEMVPGVINAHKNSTIGDGPYIWFNIISDECYYDFAYKWGDCGSQCICHYIWKFKVNSECQVTYLGNENNIGGCQLPPPINCNIFTSLNEYSRPSNSFIYPNPSNEKITISSLATSGNTQLSIFNVSGEIVLERQLTNNETQLDISALPRGVYFVRLQNEKMVEVGKMVKE